MKGNYDDIINFEYKGIKNHKKMSIYNRSAQFAPFAALKGYDHQISEKARLTDEKKILSNQLTEGLDLKLSILKENLDSSPIVKIIYFVKDGKKKGGFYKEIIGTVKRIDVYEQLIIMYNGVSIYVKDIYKIESDICNENEGL